MGIQIRSSHSTRFLMTTMFTPFSTAACSALAGMYAVCYLDH